MIAYCFLNSLLRLFFEPFLRKFHVRFAVWMITKVKRSLGSYLIAVFLFLVMVNVTARDQHRVNKSYLNLST